MGFAGEVFRPEPAAASEAGVLLAELEFALSSRRLANGTVVVAARGEIDLYTAPELARALAAALAESTADLVVDLTETTFIDSTALHVILRAARQLEGEAGQLIVVAPGPNVRRVFELTGIDNLLAVVSRSILSLPS